MFHLSIFDINVIHGELAQVVERPIRIRKVPGSMPGFSISSFSFIKFNLSRKISGSPLTVATLFFLRGTDEVRTRDLRFTRPTPYHLATAPEM